MVVMVLINSGNFWANFAKPLCCLAQSNPFLNIYWCLFYCAKVHAWLMSDRVDDSRKAIKCFAWLHSLRLKKKKNNKRKWKKNKPKEMKNEGRTGGRK